MRLRDALSVGYDLLIAEVVCLFRRIEIAAKNKELPREAEKTPWTDNGGLGVDLEVDGGGVASL